jgi:WD40 repeat protein
MEFVGFEPTEQTTDGNATDEISPSFLYFHQGFDKLCIHSCVVYDMGITISSLDCQEYVPENTALGSISPFNSQHYIIFAENDLVKVIDTITQEIRELKGHRSPILSVVCRGQNEVYTMSRDGGVNIWDPWDSSGLQWKSSLNGSRSNLTSFAVSSNPEGVLIATTKDGYLCAWNRSTYLPIHTSLIDSRGLFSSAICESNQLLLVGGHGRLHIHEEEFRSFSHVTTLGGHSGPILSIVTANGYVATGGEDKSIVIHQLNTFEQVACRRNAHASAVTSLLHHSETIPKPSSVPLTYLISGGRDNQIQIMAFPTLELLFTITGHEGRITALALSPRYHNHQNRPALLSCSSDKTLKIWKIYRSFNWERRKYFMMLLVNSGFIQLNLMRALLQMDNHSKTGDSTNGTETCEAEIVKEVFGNKGILREIMAFI